MRRNVQTAYAKINLSLDILGRMDNGYHIVKMVMQTIDLSDELIFETRDIDCPASMEITLVSDNGEIPAGEDNLIVRAVRRMEAKYSIRKDLKITLKKRIPVAAGLAGGSTDAAAALRAVRDLFVPEVSDEELQKIGVTLGADIPYCITGGTQLSEGIGEVLTVLPDAPQCGLVIVKPPVGVSTGEVYKRYDSLDQVTHPDIDAQIRREREYERRLSSARSRANLDELTGVKTKSAYQNMSEHLSRQIEDGQNVQYAIALCRVRDLTRVNETQGRNAGDMLIRDACSLICDTFKHSPVFRVAGDQFAVIIQGRDLKEVDSLVTEMAQKRDSRAPAVSCGIAVYDGTENVASVFARAERLCT